MPVQFTRKLLYPIIVAGAIGFSALLPAEQADSTGALAPAHDLYNPARTALVNARRQLAETFRQEEDILRQRQRVHEELDESLTLLANARQLDPAMAEPIEALRKRIAALEQDPCASRLDSETMKDLYDRLLADFETLIEHY
jgi:chromosome segregation ATPase